jgi:ABC-type amino acid transport substrate-binding protein
VVDPAVGRPSDLASMRVGYVADASSIGPLRALGVRPRPYPDVLDGLRAVASKEINAFVHDEPILTWYVPEVDGVVVSGVSFAPQDYAIVLPNNTPYREAVNRAVLEVVGSSDWTTIQRRYLGGE